MAKTIYLYRTQDAVIKADYQVPRNIPKKNVLGKFELDNPQHVIDNPGKVIPQRIVALAQRYQDELRKEALAPARAVLPDVLVTLSFWKRLVWLFTGKV